MAWSTPPDKSPGDVLTAANVDVIKDDLNFLANPAFIHATASSTSSIADATWQLIAYDGETEKTSMTHSTSVDNSRITVAAGFDGLYELIVQQGWANNATGIRELNARKNSAGSQSGGTSLVQASHGSGSGTTDRPLLVFTARLVAGDYVEVFTRQLSGGSLALNASGSFIQMRWVSL